VFGDILYRERPAGNGSGPFDFRVLVTGLTDSRPDLL
jgi:hypothetical protein